MKVYHGVKGEIITMANWKQRERIPGQIVDRQNKRIKSSLTQSASYGPMEFWKNVDFWQSVLLYVGMIVLFYCFGMLAGLIQ